jgi:Skp family chaperone for outer membrane proteins
MNWIAKSGWKFGSLLACGALMGVASWQTLSSRAWAGGDEREPGVRIATVDMLAVVERVVLSEPFATQRDALTKERTDAVDAMRNAMSDLEGRAKLLPAESPELKALQQDYAKAQQAAREATDNALSEIEALNLRQLSDAYVRVNEACKTLASELGYSHVLATRVGDLEFRSANVNGAVQEMIARGVVVSPGTDDLTQRLIERLGVAAVVVPAVGDALPQAVPAEAPR